MSFSEPFSEGRAWYRLMPMSRARFVAVWDGAAAWPTAPAVRMAQARLVQQTKQCGESWGGLIVLEPVGVMHVIAANAVSACHIQ